MLFLITLINWVSQAIVIIVLIDVVLTYFMSPYHPIRQFLDRIVNPMLDPIRRVVPPLGGLDFSPIVLIILVQVVASLLTRLLITL